MALKETREKRGIRYGLCTLRRMKKLDEFFLGPNKNKKIQRSEREIRTRAIKSGGRRRATTGGKASFLRTKTRLSDSDGRERERKQKVQTENLI